MCTIKKSAAAAAALMAALVVSAGCPREEGTAAKPKKPSPDAVAGAVTSTSIEALPSKTAEKLPAENRRGLSPFVERAPSPDGREQKGTVPLSAGGSWIGS
jgi:hypothetical protein